jgi:hypothetical protein
MQYSIFISGLAGVGIAEKFISTTAGLRIMEE